MNLTQLVPLTLALIMFSMGLSLTMADFNRLLMQPRAALVGLMCQLLLLPLTAYLVAIVFQLPATLLLGLLLVALCPGGVTSNLASKHAGGDVALSISLTAISSIVTVFSLPLVLNLAANTINMSVEQFSLPFLPTITQLSTLTILPLILGNAKPPFLSATDEVYSTKVTLPCHLAIFSCDSHDMVSAMGRHQIINAASRFCSAHHECTKHAGWLVLWAILPITNNPATYAGARGRLAEQRTSFYRCLYFDRQPLSSNTSGILLRCYGMLSNHSYSSQPEH